MGAEIQRGQQGSGRSKRGFSCPLPPPSRQRYLFTRSAYRPWSPGGPVDYFSVVDIVCLSVFLTIAPAKCTGVQPRSSTSSTLLNPASKHRRTSSTSPCSKQRSKQRSKQPSSHNGSHGGSRNRRFSERSGLKNLDSMRHCHTSHRRTVRCLRMAVSVHAKQAKARSQARKRAHRKGAESNTHTHARTHARAADLVHHHARRAADSSFRMYASGTSTC